MERRWGRRKQTHTHRKLKTHSIGSLVWDQMSNGNGDVKCEIDRNEKSTTKFISNHWHMN